jgi:hypothetical protein
LEIEQAANGTILVGVFRDQPELLGALQAMHDFGVELVEVRQRCTSVPRDAGGTVDSILAGPVDLDELDKSVRAGWERRRGSTVPYAGPTN